MLYTLYKRPTGQLRTSDNIFGIAIFRQTVLAAQIVWTVLAQELFFLFSCHAAASSYGAFVKFVQSSSFSWLFYICHHDIVTDSVWMSYFNETICQRACMSFVFRDLKKGREFPFLPIIPCTLGRDELSSRADFTILMLALGTVPCEHDI